MKNKLLLKFGAVLLTGALMAGCGTTGNDNEIDQREDEAPIEDNNLDTDMNKDEDRNDTNRNDMDQNDQDEQNDRNNQNDKNNTDDEDMNDLDMNDQK